MLYNIMLHLLQNIYSSMYKKLNISMDSIFIQLHIKWTGKHISINQIIDYNSDILCRHVCELEKLSPAPGPPPLQSSISRQQAHKKRQTWEEHKVLQGKKGCRLKYKQAMETMDYSFLALQFLYFQCIQRVPYIVLQWGNGRSNPSDLKAYGRPRDK